MSVTELRALAQGNSPDAARASLEWPEEKHFNPLATFIDLTADDNEFGTVLGLTADCCGLAAATNPGAAIPALALATLATAGKVALDLTKMVSKAKDPIAPVRAWATGTVRHSDTGEKKTGWKAFVVAGSAISNLGEWAKSVLKGLTILDSQGIASVTNAQGFRGFSHAINSLSLATSLWSTGKYTTRIVEAATDNVDQMKGKEGERQFRVIKALCGLLENIGYVALGVLWIIGMTTAIAISPIVFLAIGVGTGACSIAAFFYGKYGKTKGFQEKTSFIPVIHNAPKDQRLTSYKRYV